MKLKVFVTRTFPGDGIALMKKHFIVRVYPKNRVIPRKELLQGVKWGDALLCLLTDKIDKEVIDANLRLKIIANLAVGFDNVDVKYAAQKGIIVTNTPGVLDDAVAEHACALLFALARRIPESDQFTKQKKYRGWEPFLLLGTQLKGKTLGIVGVGRIGSGVAKRCHDGLGMNVLYTDIKRNSDFETEFSAKYCSLPELLKQADFVSLHVPLLPSTRHLMSTKQFAIMKKTAYLINTSRGPVVDEKALVKALQQKQLAGAGLDVFEFEPNLAPGLEKLSNVILTPHTASATIEARSAMGNLAGKNVTAVLRGKKPLTPIVIR